MLTRAGRDTRGLLVPKAARLPAKEACIFLVFAEAQWESAQQGCTCMHGTATNGAGIGPRRLPHQTPRRDHQQCPSQHVPSPSNQPAMGLPRTLTSQQHPARTYQTLRKLGQGAFGEVGP